MIRNYRRYRLRVPLFLILGMGYLALFPGAGGAGAQEKRADRILIFDPVDMSAGDQGGGMGDLFGDSVAIELESQGFQPIPEERAEALAAEGQILEKSSLLEMARSAGADLVISGLFRVEDGSVFFGIRAYDVETGQIGVAISEKAAAGLAVYDSIDAIAAKMSAAVRREYRPLESAVVETETEETVVEERVEEKLVELGGETREITLLSQDEGAAVKPGEHYPAGYILNGSYTFRCKEGSRLRVEIRKPGYRPRRYTFRVRGDQTEYQLPPLRPLAHSGKMGFHITEQKPLGATFSYALPVLPGTLEAPLRAGLYVLPYEYTLWLVPDGVHMINSVLEAGLTWQFWSSPADRWHLAAGAGLSMDSFFFPSALATEAWPWLGFGTVYAELQQEFRAGRRLIFFIQEQYKTPGLVGPAPVTGKSFGQFFLTAGVQWVL